MGAFDDLPTLAEVEADRVGKPILKGKSRLDRREDERVITVVNDREFARQVWVRDQHRCRWCNRKVFKSLTRDATRGEVHHVHGRLGDFRHMVRCALLLCGACHQLVTGAVDERWVIVGTVKFEHEGRERIDAGTRVIFNRVA